jgi:hypothetical protein
MFDNGNHPWVFVVIPGTSQVAAGQLWGHDGTNWTNISTAVNNSFDTSGTPIAAARSQFYGTNQPMVALRKSSTVLSVINWDSSNNIWRELDSVALPNSQTIGNNLAISMTPYQSLGAGYFGAEFILVAGSDNHLYETRLIAKSGSRFLQGWTDLGQINVAGTNYSFGGDSLAATFWTNGAGTTFQTVYPMGWNFFSNPQFAAFTTDISTDWTPVLQGWSMTSNSGGTNWPSTGTYVGYGSVVQGNINGASHETFSVCYDSSSSTYKLCNMWRNQGINVFNWNFIN